MKLKDFVKRVIVDLFKKKVNTATLNETQEEFDVLDRIRFKPDFSGGINGTYDLDDNHYISIIMTTTSYGGNMGQFEIAVVNKLATNSSDHLVKLPKILKGEDVEGWLTLTELRSKIIEIENYFKNKKRRK